MSLSERFSKLQNKAAGGGNANRKFANFNKQKSVRSVGMNAKRGIVTALMNTKQQNLLRKAQNKKVSEQTRKKKVVAKTKIGTPSKKNAKNTQSTKAKKPAAKKVTPKKAAPKKAAPKKAAAAPKPTNEDLNMEMDQYWFTHGKGPDPVQAKLDRDMDEYQKSRAAEAVVSAEAVVPAEAADVPMEA